jgi:hypothetical protein
MRGFAEVPMRHSRFKLFAALCCTLVTGAAMPAHAQKKGEEAKVVLHSTITGNQEQPKVLYIVPWQGPGGTDSMAQPIQPLINDVFTPIDRQEFQRELKYRALATQPAAPEAAP